jgi:hypothetical protein
VSARRLAAIMAIVTSGCVTFDREAPSRIEQGRIEEARAPLGEDEIVRRLRYEHPDEAKLMAIRFTSSGYPEFGLLLREDGLVRFVGGFGARCYGTLIRQVSTSAVRKLAQRLQRALRDESTYFTTQAPGDTARFRLQVRTDAGLIDKTFYSNIDNPRFYDAVDAIGRLAGTRSMWEALPPRGQLNPLDCASVLLFP